MADNATGPATTGTATDAHGTLPEDRGDKGTLNNNAGNGGGNLPMGTTLAATGSSADAGMGPPNQPDNLLEAQRAAGEAGKGTPGQSPTSAGDPTDSGAPAG
jgi:hypothetical protein